MNKDFKSLLDENENFLEVIEAIIDEHIEDKKFSSKIIEKELSINRTKLNKIIRETTGKTVKNYIIEYRLLKATDLIKTGIKDLDEVAKKVGFSNGSFLKDSCKKHFNKSIEGF
ncbi:helix-turn-helix domain-containing protein [Reichenbachiella versicolor]|uniref:helix-turn-helix domain-containing protein n=1 Tax=Reichenbachiella versicolor TaxID=1821036 RepID=UPI0013A5B648|nr:helix-turn-helix domain-containing protein [Reichenbachiella versicolor]